MKSNAPFFVASTAVLIVPWPETTIDRQRLVHRAQPLEHLDAVHAGHLHVEQHEVGRLALGERQPFLAGRGAEELVALVLEGHPQRVADGGLVVDDEDAGFGHRVSAVVDADGLQLPLIEVGRVDVERRGCRRARRRARCGGSRRPSRRAAG